MSAPNCEDCWYYDYDEELDDYVCIKDLDEDEVYRMYAQPFYRCPYFKPGDEYSIAKRQ